MPAGRVRKLLLSDALTASKLAVAALSTDSRTIGARRSPTIAPTYGLFLALWC